MSARARRLRAWSARLDPPAGDRGARSARREVGVAAEIYSAPSFQLLRKDALEAERWNRLHPDARQPRVPYVSQVLPHEGGPIVAATDWLKALPDMVARWLPPYYVSLGTDGFGRSDRARTCVRCSRSTHRRSPPRQLVGLVRCGALESKVASKAIRELGLDPEKVDPVAL